MKHTLIVIDRTQNSHICVKCTFDDIETAVKSYRTFVADYADDINDAKKHVQLICNIDAGE